MFRLANFLDVEPTSQSQVFCTGLSVFPTILTSYPIPAKYLHNMILPQLHVPMVQYVQDDMKCLLFITYRA